MRHTFTASQWIPRPAELVFAFFANPRNLILLMPSWHKARIDQMQIVPPPVSGDANGSGNAAGAGSMMTISFRPFPLSPVRLRWEARISEFAWCDHFCDEQVSGPFAYWKHCHRLQEDARGGVTGTGITDEIVYEMKMASAGELAHSLFFSNRIRRLFDYRHSQLEKIFSTVKAVRS
jgi:ligand-binding SRPBCC domain-containing protein